MKNRQHKRNGYPLVSDKMLDVLRVLKAAKDSGYPFMQLENVHHRTLAALQNFDLILKSDDPVLAVIRYIITGRGLKTLAAYDTVVKRDDGICCRCGITPRTSRYPSGLLYPYCDECMKEIGRKRYAFKGYQLDPETRCSKCHRNKRAKLPNGQIIAYCRRCRKGNRKRERKRKMKRKLALIKAGTPPICCHCKTEPVYHTKKTVYDYCYDCYRQQQNEYARKRLAEDKAKHFANKLNERTDRND